MSRALAPVIRDRHPDIPIVLVTPITCTVVERPRALAVGSLTLRRIRNLEAEIVAARQSAGDANLHLVQGPDLFGPDDVDDLPDGLHPNAAGYQRMGERFHTLAFEDGPFLA